MTAALYIAIALVLIANVVVNVGVFRATSYTHRQKLAQSALIWLVPIFGVIAVGLFLQQLAYVPERRPDHFPDRTGGEGVGGGNE